MTRVNFVLLKFTIQSLMKLVFYLFVGFGFLWLVSPKDPPPYVTYLQSKGYIGITTTPISSNSKDCLNLTYAQRFAANKDGKARVGIVCGNSVDDMIIQDK